MYIYSIQFLYQVVGSDSCKTSMASCLLLANQSESRNGEGLKQLMRSCQGQTQYQPPHSPANLLVYLKNISK